LKKENKTVFLHRFFGFVSSTKCMGSYGLQIQIKNGNYHQSDPKHATSAAPGCLQQHGKCFDGFLLQAG
jgi:hypothetical protein